MEDEEVVEGEVSVISRERGGWPGTVILKVNNAKITFN